MIRIVRTIAYMSVLGLFSTAPGQTTKLDLLGAFDDGWQEQWVERKVRGLPTVYEVVEEDSNKVLMALSEKSSSALWRMLDLQVGNTGKISWRWKVDNTLSKDKKEKTKKGDDYAARVYVVFEPHIVSWKTRAICYVWAAGERVRSVYSNPYAETVKTLVVRSGDEKEDEWLDEERDFVADYTEIFGKPPKMVTAVAIMVDTDNTGQTAISYFDDLSIEYSEPEEKPKEEQEPASNPNG